MQPEPTDVSQRFPSQNATLDAPNTSQHGHRRGDDLQDSPQPHFGEAWGDSELSTGGVARDATFVHQVTNGLTPMEANGLKNGARPSPTPRDRITEYENALANSPRKPSEGPLFEVVKSNRSPDDKSSPIAKLPNGAWQLSLTVNYKGKLRANTNFAQRCLSMLSPIFRPTISPQFLSSLVASTMSSLLHMHGKWLSVAPSLAHMRSRTRSFGQVWKTLVMLYGRRRGGSLGLLHWRRGEASISYERDFYDPWFAANQFKYPPPLLVPARCRQSLQ
jgi:hypothetical protein